jgi:hypothetical protein
LVPVTGTKSAHQHHLRPHSQKQQGQPRRNNSVLPTNPLFVNQAYRFADGCTRIAGTHRLIENF